MEALYFTMQNISMARVESTETKQKYQYFGSCEKQRSIFDVKAPSLSENLRGRVIVEISVGYDALQKNFPLSVGSHLAKLRMMFRSASILY